MFVVRSPAKLPHRSARAFSASSQVNSARYAGGLDRSYASMTFESEIDLLPCSSRTVWSLGRLMPIGVIGPESPISTTTSMAVAVMPRTPSLR